MDDNPRDHSTTKKESNQEQKLGYVYRHIRLDTNEVFYIGKGTLDKGKYKRANSKYDRNKYWHNIIRKHNYRVEIVIENIPMGEVFKKEVELILYYGRLDLGTGTLVNMTSGGDRGGFGLISTRRIVLEEYNEIGVLINIFVSITHFFNMTGIKLNTNKKSINKEGYYSKGYKIEIISDTLYKIFKLSEYELQASKKRSSKSHEIQLDIYDEYNNFIKNYPSLKSSRIDGFSSTGILQSIKGNIKSSNGYRFEKITNNHYKGIKLTDDEKNEIIKLSKDKISASRNKIAIEIFNKNGEFIKKYDTMNKAIIDGFDIKSINRCIKNNTIHHKGYKFIKIKDNLIYGYELNENDYVKKIRGIKLKLFDFNNIIYKEYNSLTEAEVDGFSVSTINKCTKNPHTSFNGHKFIKISLLEIHGFKLSQEPYIKKKHNVIILFDIDGNIFKKYNTMVSMKEDGFHVDCINRCMSGKQSSHKGYIFKKIKNNLIHGYQIK